MRILINAKKQAEILLKKGFRAFLVQNFFHHGFRLFSYVCLIPVLRILINAKKTAGKGLFEVFYACNVQCGKQVVYCFFSPDLNYFFIFPKQ